ncbi:MAG: MurT ligase domain-containing protein [Raoultibacter sp.]
MGVRKVCAEGISAASTWVLKNVFHRPAANFPGKIALYVDPRIIADLAPKLRKGSLVVCGTNGKTTTCNLLADALETAGEAVICNRTGANLDSGVASALLHGTAADWGVFESDELWLAKILPQLRSRYLVLLNLFRDQLDRCGEIDRIQESIIGALAASPETVLVYNADDPLCAAIALKAPNKTIAFGIGEDLRLEQNTVADAQMCQMCASMLGYTYRQYGQLGDFACPTCGFKRAQLDFAARDVRVGKEGLSFAVETLIAEKPHKVAAIQSRYSGAYMVYNLLATFTAAHLAGCSCENFQKAVDAYDPQNGRLQDFVVAGRSVLLNLAKNPTGFNQNMKLIIQDDAPCAVAFFVNDKEGDGHDVSWLWDVDFEELAAQPDVMVFAGGLRKNDVQVRLKYAGITSVLVEGAADVFAHISETPSARSVYLIANYTALPPVHAELTQMTAPAVKED